MSATLAVVMTAAFAIPGWVQSVARYNPVEWTIQTGREALTASPDWGWS